MPRATTRPFGLATVLVLCLCLSAACGGKSSSKSDPQATLTFSTAYSQFQVAYLGMSINDTDRALAYCAGPNDPKPANTPVPDPSGHSRGQISCLEAGAQAATKLAAYREIITKFESSTSTPTQDSRINNARNAILKAHKAREQLYQDAAAAAAKNDANAAAALPVRYKEINTLSDDMEKAVQVLGQQAK